MTHNKALLQAFNYGHTRGGAILATVGLLALALLMSYLALSKPLGLPGVTSDILDLAPAWVFGVLAGAFVVLAYLASREIAVSVDREDALKLYGHELNLRTTQNVMDATSIGLSDITNVSKTKLDDRRFTCHIDHRDGRLSLKSSFFDSLERFETFVTALNTQLAAQMSAAPMPTTIPYRPKPLAAILATVFFAACAAVLGWTAWTNDAGLILNGIFTFTERGATIFYGVLALVSALAVAAGLRAIWQSFTSKAELVLTDHSLSVPGRFSSKGDVEIQLADITGLRRYAIQGQEHLEIHHSGGKTTVSRAFFPNKDSFERLAEHIAAELAGQGA